MLKPGTWTTGSSHRLRVGTSSSQTEVYPSLRHFGAVVWSISECGWRNSSSRYQVAGGGGVEVTRQHLCEGVKNGILSGRG